MEGEYPCCFPSPERVFLSVRAVSRKAVYFAKGIVYFLLLWYNI